MAKAKNSSRGRVTPTPQERETIRRGSEKGKRTLRADSALIENVQPKDGDMESVEDAARRDFNAMKKKEGDPFALKRREGTRYETRPSDVKKGVVQDPNVFKGADAPLPRATSRQLTDAAAAQRRLDAVKESRDAGRRITKNTKSQEEKDRKKVGLISQYSGGSGLDSQRCATPGCNNNTDEITCTDCTAAGDPAGKKYRDAPHERSTEYAATGGQGKTSRNVELQNGMSQGRGAA